jgi:hypothetical protein
MLQYATVNKSTRRVASRNPPIPPPPSVPLRHQRLGPQCAKFIEENSQHPIALTIQPNFGWSDGATGSDRVKRLTRDFFYEADRLYTTCPQPQWLAHIQRSNGFAVVEKRNNSPHVHILLSCETASDRIFRSTFLLEVADNVVKACDSSQEDRWRRTTREFIVHHPWSRTRSWAPNESLLTQFARKATVMVQMTFTDDDIRRWTGYMTKAWGYSTDQLAARRTVPVDDWALDWFELREFFPPERAPVARPWKRGPHGTRILDLDEASWRRPGKGILK